MQENMRRDYSMLLCPYLHGTLVFRDLTLTIHLTNNK
jgi:hypothetical protein